MTAIAAAIACSTPSFAQSADPPVAETPAPVVAAPVAPAPVADTPIVPDTPVAADTLAPAEAAAKPAPRKATTAKASPATKAPIARSRPAPARVASAAPVAAPAPAAASVAPVAEVPVVEPLPVPAEAAPVAAPAAPAEASSLDGMIPAAAAGGLAILGLAGAGLALRRRRRAADAEEAAMHDAKMAVLDDAEPEMIVEPEPEPAPVPVPVEPAFVAAATPAAEAVSEPSPEIDGPVTELPEDFDLSRFSPQVQAAYKGPTEDNPSLSLKNRLRRANGMDQLAEREAEAEVAAAPVEAPHDQPAAPLAEGEFMLTKPGTKPALRPAYPK